MYKIVKKQELGQDTYLIEVEAPKIALAALPGQFVIVKADEHAERIPLTVSDADLQDGTIALVVKTIGYSTRKMVTFEVGQSFQDVVGPPADGGASEIALLFHRGRCRHRADIPLGQMDGTASVGM